MYYVYKHLYDNNGALNTPIIGRLHDTSISRISFAQAVITRLEGRGSIRMASMPPCLRYNQNVAAMIITANSSAPPLARWSLFTQRFWFWSPLRELMLPLQNPTLRGWLGVYLL
jgi:hypothetical protein